MWDLKHEQPDDHGARMLPFERVGKIRKAFEQFHADNPHVYDKLRELALVARDAGVPKMGMKALFERMRWHFVVVTKTYDFKLNNNYTAFYARKLMRDEPTLRGIFETRASVADDAEETRQAEAAQEAGSRGVGVERSGVQ